MKKLLWIIVLTFGTLAVVLELGCIGAVYWAIFHPLSGQWANFWIVNFFVGIIAGLASWTTWLFKLS